MHGRPYASIAQLNALAGANTLTFVKLQTYARGNGYITAAPAILDEIYFPSACKGAGLTSAQLAQHQQVYTSLNRTTPAVGGIVVQERTCARRTIGTDCTPWSASPCTTDACRTARTFHTLNAQSNQYMLATFGDGTATQQYLQVGDATVRYTQQISGAIDVGTWSTGGRTQELTSTCYRADLGSQQFSLSDSTYREIRAALVVRFGSAFFDDPDATSALRDAACTGAPMTVAQAEGRFPTGLGLREMNIAASVGVTEAERHCQPGPNGDVCDAWTKSPCNAGWCQKASSATTLTLVQHQGNIGIDLTALSPVLEVSVADGSVAPGASAEAPASPTLVTGSCFRYALRRDWNGDPTSGWTERRAVVLATY